MHEKDIMDSRIIYVGIFDWLFKSWYFKTGQHRL